MDFEEAALVFLDPNRIESDDTWDDDGEGRFQVIGVAAGRILFVVYTERRNRIRLISARRATGSERKSYEDAFGP